MRTRIADLIHDAISIIEACDDPDCEAWLGQARAELALIEAKAALRHALTDVHASPKPVVKAVKRKPAKAKAYNGANAKAPAVSPLVPLVTS
jgi:hypothetical protein